MELVEMASLQELNLARGFLQNPEVFRLSPKISERLYKIT